MTINAQYAEASHLSMDLRIIIGDTSVIVVGLESEHLI